MVLGSDYIHLKQNCSCQTCFFASQVTYHFHSKLPQHRVFFISEFQGTATSTAAQDPHSSAETQRPSPKRSTTWHGLSQLRRFHEAKFPPFRFTFVSKLPRHWMAKWIELLFTPKSYNSLIHHCHQKIFQESPFQHHGGAFSIFQCKSVRSQVFGNSFVKAPLSWGQFHPTNMSAVLCPLLSFCIQWLHFSSTKSTPIHLQKTLQLHASQASHNSRHFEVEKL